MYTGSNYFHSYIFSDFINDDDFNTYNKDNIIAIYPELVNGNPLGANIT